MQGSSVSTERRRRDCCGSLLAWRRDAHRGAAAGGLLMNAERLMTRNVRACSRAGTLEQPARIMRESDVGCVVVSDDEQRPVGMITDRDVAMRSTRNVWRYETRVSNSPWPRMSKARPH